MPNRKRKQPLTKSHGDQLRERVTWLINRHTQSAISRATGTSISSVNRYVHGARIPGEFCIALVEELGVNPAWLLTGGPSPYLSEVPYETKKLGERLLELVESMSAVTRMKLGSLAGKPDMQTLRQLNDALQSHQRLRNDLNHHSAPWFRDLLQKFNQALDSRDLVAAGELRKSVDQISRLNLDDDLHLKHQRLQTYHEFLLGNNEEVLRRQRRIYLRLLADSEHIDEQLLASVRRLVLSLQVTGRQREALRVCLAIEDLAEGDVRDSQAWWDLQVTHAAVLYDLGNLREGLPKVQSAMPHASRSMAAAAEDSLVRMLLWSNAIPLADACRMGKPTLSKGLNFVEYGAWIEDRESIDRALKYIDRVEVPDELPAGLMLDNARAVKAPSASAASSFDSRWREAAMADSDPTIAMLFLAHLTNLLWKSGKRKKARQELERARQSIEARSSGSDPNYHVQALYHRSVVRILQANPTQRERVNQSIEFFKTGLRNNQATFRAVVSAAAP